MVKIDKLSRQADRSCRELAESHREAAENPLGAVSSVNLWRWHMSQVGKAGLGCGLYMRAGCAGYGFGLSWVPLPKA
ncbi:hypothetical protein SDJN03_30284, partial [Cucurbita argyrosperma subsp. sororia]